MNDSLVCYFGRRIGVLVAAVTIVLGLSNSVPQLSVATVDAATSTAIMLGVTTVDCSPGTPGETVDIVVGDKVECTSQPGWSSWSIYGLNLRVDGAGPTGMSLTAVAQGPASISAIFTDDLGDHVVEFHYTIAPKLVIKPMRAASAPVLGRHGDLER